MSTAALTLSVLALRGYSLNLPKEVYIIFGIAFGLSVISGTFRIFKKMLNFVKGKEEDFLR